MSDYEEQMHNLEITAKEYARKRKIALLRCSYCRAHANENKGRCATHGGQKPKYKDHRDAE